MNTGINLTFEIDCINFNDTGNFLTVGTFDTPEIDLTISGNQIIKRNILSSQREILTDATFITKYSTESLLNKLKVDIDVNLDGVTTHKDLVLKILDLLSLTYIDTNYSSSLAYQGTKNDAGFIEFENTNALNIILYCLAIDGYVMLINEAGNIFFESKTKAIDITPDFAEVNFESIANRKITGMEIYSCDSVTTEDNKLVTIGDGSFFYVQRFFNDDAVTQATAFGNAIVNGFENNIEVFKFKSAEYYALGSVFNVNNTNLGIVGNFMILGKRIVEQSGSLVYFYTAVKNTQCIQLYLLSDIISKTLTFNNFKTHENVDIGEDLSVIDDTITISGFRTYYDGSIPKIDIYFDKAVKSTYNTQTFKLWWEL